MIQRRFCHAPQTGSKRDVVAGRQLFFRLFLLGFLKHQPAARQVGIASLAQILVVLSSLQLKTIVATRIKKTSVTHPLVARIREFCIRDASVGVVLGKHLARGVLSMVPPFLFITLRAELLSALIGSISLIPFIISSGTGAEIEKPLAIVVVGGMVMSPLKIVILPMIYEWVERGATRRAAKEVS